MSQSLTPPVRVDLGVKFDEHLLDHRVVQDADGFAALFEETLKMVGDAAAHIVALAKAPQERDRQLAQVVLRKDLVVVVAAAAARAAAFDHPQLGRLVVSVLAGHVRIPPAGAIIAEDRGAGAGRCESCKIRG
jgi:hypothetical protein